MTILKVMISQYEQTLTRAQVIIIFDETVNAVKVFDDLFPNLVKNILEKGWKWWQTWHFQTKVIKTNNLIQELGTE